MGNVEISGDVPSNPDGTIAYRSNDRYYLNSPWGVLTDDFKLQQAYRVALWSLRTERRDVTRCVGRFLVTDSVLQNMEESLLNHLEVAIPTEVEIDGSGRNERAWLVMFGMNAPSRRSPHSQEEMARKVARDVNRPHPMPLDRLRDLSHRGFTFESQIDPARVRELFSLWGETFGWTSEGIMSRSRKIIQQLEREPQDRTMWFSGLEDASGSLVAAALGERLDMYVGHGHASLPLVEITEWRRSDDAFEHGLMAGSVAFLNAQIVRDLEGLSLQPLIFAETNYESRAHRVGFAVGMETSVLEVRGKYVTQVLEQNVEVRDGHFPEGLRDFTFVYNDWRSLRYRYPVKATSVFFEARGEEHV